MAISDKTTYGVTPQGFVRMRLPEIQADLFNRLEQKLGTPVSRTANSVIGVLIGLIAEESDRQWQLAEADYYARSPMTADDGSIDNTIIYSGVLRKQAESTYLYLVCYGRNGMILPANAQVKSEDGYKYNIEATSTISLDNCVNVIFSIPLIEVGREYGFLLNGKIRATHEATAEDTVESIYVSLLSQISDYDDWKGSVTDGQLKLSQTDRRYGGICVPTETLNVIEVGSPIKFIAEETGPIEPVIGSIKSINTVYDGWNGVSNESEAYVGRATETVTELRQRYAAAVYKNSISMKESIRAALLALPDVDAVTVYENRSDIEVDGLKPHSFLVIIHGGDDIEIAQTILAKAPIGIDTNGDIEMEITDTEGTLEKVYFSRPVEVPIYAKVTVHEYKEESLPGDVVALIKEIIIQTGSQLGMGKDVIAQRFLGPIYSRTTGIGYLTLTVSKDSISYTEKSIPIDRGEIATFMAKDISVEMELDT